MKLFKSLLVAPATLGLLAPLSATANEVNFNAISNYSQEVSEIDSNSFKPSFAEDILISGGEGLVDDHDGSFSETTTASFGVDFLLGSVDGATSEATTFDYQMGIGLETSFTGEDSLSATIDIGDVGGEAGGASGLGFDSTGNNLTLDGLTYTFPLGGATVMVGDSTDISAVFTGACAYSSLTDYMGNCGTGNSVGVGGKGATVAASYAFDSGLSIAGGISGTPSDLGGMIGDDVYAVELAYSGDNYGVSGAYAVSETTASVTDGGEQTMTTYYGLNAYYSPEGFPTISAGIEAEDPLNGRDEKSGWFTGVSFPEVGPGSLDIGYGTAANYTDTEEEYYTFEASYAYPVNDSMTITPGFYTTEGTTDKTGYIVKTSFSF